MLGARAYVRSKPLSLSRPVIDEDTIREVVEALESGWLTTGPRAARLEEEFARFLGAPAALALSSGTAALHLGLLTAGVRPGDRVVSSVMTFPGVIGVIEQAGAHPVLVDVEEDTLNLDPREVAACFDDAPAPRVILVTHLYGHPCDLHAVASIARQYGAALVEDAAHALPARFRGRLIGGGGALAAFSFYATKTLTTAEGGMLVGASELIDEARVMSLHGIARERDDLTSRRWRYDVVAPGFKYNMPDVLAAIGLHQLPRQNEFLRHRRAVAARYDAAFWARPELQVPVERLEVVSSRHLYPLRLRLERLRIDRDAFIDEMSARGIETSVHFLPVHLHPYFRDRYGFKEEDFPVASREYHRLVSLPMDPGLSEDDVDQVVHAALDVIARFGR